LDPSSRCRMGLLDEGLRDCCGGPPPSPVSVGRTRHTSLRAHSLLLQRRRDGDRSSNSTGRGLTLGVFLCRGLLLTVGSPTPPLSALSMEVSTLNVVSASTIENPTRSGQKSTWRCCHPAASVSGMSSPSTSPSAQLAIPPAPNTMLALLHLHMWAPLSPPPTTPMRWIGDHRSVVGRWKRGPEQQRRPPRCLVLNTGPRAVLHSDA
jgi:hypothetical protein